MVAQSSDLSSCRNLAKSPPRGRVGDRAAVLRTLFPREGNPINYGKIIQ